MGAAAVCLVTAVYLAGVNHDADLLRRADDQRRAREYAAAEATARQVRRPPFEVQALVVRAQALERLGRLRAAEAAYTAAVLREPNDWFVHRGYAVVLRRLGKRPQAIREMSAALALNPRMKLPYGFVRKHGSGVRRR
jgi:tetratricopeptide (TPR) repeat protein